MAITEDQLNKIGQMKTTDVVTVIYNRIRQELPPVYQSAFKAMIEPSREDIIRIIDSHDSNAM